MTRVCLVGDPEVNLQYELLSRETSREALATYDLERPFENTLAVRTVSIGAAVSLLNDLNWYLTRFVDEALVQEPSISDDEWLSRSLARQLRNGAVEPDATAEFCKIYGLERVGPAVKADGDGPTDGSDSDPRTDSSNSRTDSSDPSTDSARTDRSDPPTDASGGTAGTHRLVEPLYVRRADGGLPEYDLRDVADTLVVRLTEEEYSP